MADPKHLEIARQGKDAWNKWRSANPDKRADFSDTDFTLPENEDISIAGFEFGHMAIFNGVRFGDEAYFDGASFGNEASFDGAMFGNVANFTSASFGNETTFTSATFGNRANFTGARFGYGVSFVGARFGDAVCFIDATFAVETTFAGASFGDWANFDDATFGYRTHFDGATFGNEARFKGTTFGGWAHFEGATFRGRARFEDTTFMGEADFTRARFNLPPDFSGAIGLKNLSLVGTQFRFGRGIFRWTTNSRIVTILRRLRGLVKEIHATDAERDLFILERHAERGVLWENWWYGGWKSRLFGWRKPLAATVWMFFYSTLSDCGRSTLKPIFWFVITNVGAFLIYARLADHKVNEALWNLTFANMLPFGTLAKPLSEHAAVELFYGGVLPPAVGLTAIGQGVVNALLVFLLALALRNHFKVK